MKELLLHYAAYNLWANNRMIDVMLKLDTGQLEKEIVSSFSSLRKTVCHVWGAEDIWLQRLLLTEQPVWTGDFEGSFEDVCRQWQHVSQQLQEFISRQYDDRALEHTFQYYDRKKQSHKNRVCDVLMHVFNHSTYHRGQLVTMLRQVGATTIPGTDLIGFLRK